MKSEERGERRREEDPLVDHERADLNLLTFQLPSVDQRVLLVKESDERRSIVPSITFRSEDEPVKKSLLEAILVESMYLSARRTPGIGIC